MADLIGTASIRVDMPTLAATRAIRRMAERSEAPLNRMKLRVAEVRKELRKLHDANVTITLDDRTSSGVATARAAVQELRDLGPVGIKATVDNETTSGLVAVREAADSLRTLGPIRIPVSLDDDTAAGAAAIRATIARMQDLGPVQIAAAIDDRTGPGSTSATTAVQALRALGPVRIPVVVDDQSSTGSASARAAVTGLQGLGPVRIPVTLDDDTAAAAAGVRATVAGLQSLGPIRITAELDSDLTVISATTAAFNELRDAVRRVSTALGTLATRATTAVAALVALGAAARTLRGEMNDLDDAVRRARTSLSGLQGSLGTVTLSAGSAGSALDGLKSAALLLSPALIPIAAQAGHLLPIAAALGAATVAVGVFAGAVAGQVGALKEVAEAEGKASEATATHGAASKEGAEAQAAYRGALGALPPATRKAAIALQILREQYRKWSDALAADTMPVVTRSFAAFGALFPKMTPLVQGTSQQLNRFVTIAAGGVQSPGFDRFMRSFAEFTTGVLQRGNDALIRFTRTLDTGKISGGVAEFMEYARENGPLVRDALSNVAQALGTILEGAANVGPGLLTVVNALAALVAAVPPGAITAMLQLAIALKAVRLAAAGMAAAGVAAAAFGAAITAMQTAAAGATGVLPKLAAAFGALSRSVKIAVAGTGIGLLIIALSELSQRGRQAPPDIDKLTGALARLGSTGKVAGEAAKAFGNDLDGLHGKVQALTDPGTADKVQQFLVGWSGWDSTPVKEAKENLDSVDKALANLVKDGRADLAAAAVKRLTAEYGKGGRDTKEFTSRLDDYKASLADAKFEQQLAADAMGLFGQQAQQTSAKLAEQKQSADGLRQAIQALNDIQRAGLGGMIAFEASIDAAAKAARDNAGSLRMVGGQLDLNPPKAQAAATALQDLASKTDEAAAANRESTGSWAGAAKIYERGRQQLIKNAMQMGLTRAEAEKLAATILKTPNKTAMLKADISDWKAKIGQAEKQLKSAKGDKKAKLTANIADWKAKVAAADHQLKGTKATKKAKLTADIGVWRARVAQAERQLKTAKGSKKARLTANISDWQRKIAAALRQINGLPKSRSTTLTTRRHYINITENRTIYTGKGGRGPNAATGGLYTGTDFRYRGKGYANGGMVDGPGTGTSDSIFAPWLSAREFVVNAKQTAKHLPLLRDINDGSLSARSTRFAGRRAELGPGSGMNVGRSITRSRSSAGGMAGGQTIVNNNYVTLENRGVIGSQMELDNWLANSLDNLQRTGRLPASLRRA
jgi:hypothetical protein